MLLTLPGVPCVYTADEVGAEFLPYKNPEPLTWEERQPGLREYQKRLITLRHQVPALHSRLWQILEVEPHEHVYAYLRYTEDNIKPVLVLLNFSNNAVQAAIPAPVGAAAFTTLANATRLTDLLTGAMIEVETRDPFTVTVPPMSALLLTLL